MTRQACHRARSPLSQGTREGTGFLAHYAAGAIRRGEAVPSCCRADRIAQLCDRSVGVSYKTVPAVSRPEIGVKRLRVLFLALISILALPTVIRARESMHHEAARQPRQHSHPSPHGGQVVRAGKYHFELVIHEGEMHLYPFSEDMTLLPVKGIIGTIEILVRGQVKRRAELKPGIDALEATLDLAGVPKFIAAVTLVIDGKALTPRFSIDFRAHHRSE